MKQNLTFEDLEGALMLISFDTVDEDGVVERETLAYTYDNSFKCIVHNHLYFCLFFLHKTNTFHFYSIGLILDSMKDISDSSSPYLA